MKDSSKINQGLIELTVFYYGFEIKPLSQNEISLRAIMLIDPQLDTMPESLINWGTKQMAEFMINKVLKIAGNLKGTKYEELIKANENAEFYPWIHDSLKNFYDKQGWIYEQNTL